MKKKEEKTNVMRILEQKKIPYTAHFYEESEGPEGTSEYGVHIARALGQDPARAFKTLVARGASGGYVVFEVPVAESLDLKKAARAAGEKSVELLHVADINAVTGYIRGGCSPVGMTAEQAAEFFSSIPRIAGKCRTLCEVGLGYVRLGQSSTTLSGGEAQRVKLATELSKPATGKTVYILDEPTTGLHTDDVKKLLEVLQRLVEGGNTVIVIEHNLDVIKCADWLIDLGPEGGDQGGTIVCAGTPETVAACPESYTGQYLKRML